MAQTDVTGTIIAELEIDLASGVIGSINLIGGDMTATGWMMMDVDLTAAMLGVVDITSTEASATAATIPTAPAVPPTTVTETKFAAADQFIRLTSGTVSVVTQLPAPVVPPTPLAGTDIPGTGDGTINSMLDGDQYDIFFSMNIDNTQLISGLPLSIMGTVVGRGTVSAVPEPTCAFALLGLFTGVAIRRRRR